MLAAGSGLAAVLAARGAGPTSRASATARPSTRALCIGVATLAIAWLFSQFSPAWTTRYLGVALGPIFLLPPSASRAPASSGLAALVIVLGIWAIPRPPS